MQIPDLIPLLERGGPLAIVVSVIFMAWLFFSKGYRLRIDLGPRSGKVTHRDNR